MSTPTGRVWTLQIVAPGDWITANPRRNNYRARSALVRTWRERVALIAYGEHLPTGLDYARIDGVAQFRGRSPVRDRANLAPTLKAAIDGLTPARTYVRQGKTVRLPGYGLIPDDNDKHLAGSDIRIGDPLGRYLRPDHPGLLTLTITELTR